MPQIRITGQADGNNTIFRKLSKYKSKKDFFTDIILYYSSLANAREDLRNAYKQLCDEEPEHKNRMGGIIKANDILYYDASKAIIVY